MRRVLATITQPSTRTTVIGLVTLITATVGVTVFVWSSLPEEMVVRWDVAGEPDGTLSRPIAAVSMPMVTLFVFGLFVLLPRIDPLGGNIERFRGHYNGFFLVLAGMLAAIHGAILAENLGYEVGMSGVVLVLSGFVIGYSGLLLRVAEPNWFVGIRTPWTLSSDSVWYETHRVGSVLFAVAGAFILALGLVELAVGIGPWAVWLLLAVVLTAAFVPVVYSYYLYTNREEDGRSTPPDS